MGRSLNQPLAHTHTACLCVRVEVSCKTKCRRLQHHLKLNLCNFFKFLPRPGDLLSILLRLITGEFNGASNSFSVLYLPFCASAQLTVTERQTRRAAATAIIQQAFEVRIVLLLDLLGLLVLTI